MDWNEILTALLKLVVMVICGLISAYVIPWLNAKKAEAKAKAEEAGWATQLETIDKFVASAEQLAINAGYDCEWKKNYVVGMIEDYLGLTVDEELNAYIESAVILLHKALYGEVTE